MATQPQATAAYVRCSQYLSYQCYVAKFLNFAALGGGLRYRLHHQEKVRVTCGLPPSGQHGVNLTTMMGLVVQKMRNEKSAWWPELALQRVAEPTQILFEPFARDAPGPVLHILVGLNALFRQLPKVIDH